MNLAFFSKQMIGELINIDGFIMELHHYPGKKPRVRKSYHLIDTPNGPSKDFQHHAYQLPDNKDITVIHYLGNEDLASNFPYCNAKHSTFTYVHTCPSYVKTLEKKCETTRGMWYTRSSTTILPTRACSCLYP